MRYQCVVLCAENAINFVGKHSTPAWFILMRDLCGALNSTRVRCAHIACVCQCAFQMPRVVRLRVPAGDRQDNVAYYGYIQTPSDDEEMFETPTQRRRVQVAVIVSTVAAEDRAPSASTGSPSASPTTSSNSTTSTSSTVILHEGLADSQVGPSDTSHDLRASDAEAGRADRTSGLAHELHASPQDGALSDTEQLVSWDNCLSSSTTSGDDSTSTSESDYPELQSTQSSVSSEQGRDNVP